ncbi:MAG TPA: DUF937 domain-containing protein [Aestuariivirgaceae bacterium]|nr:DUF937 domain-containing protein [Aestuariivirgaceae bacterium]
MSLMALMAAGQQGLLIQTVGGVVGVEEPVAREALERLSRAIARRLSARVAVEPAEHEVLLDVVARGGFEAYLDDPRALFGRAAVRDGEDVLAYAYGSVEAAREEAKAVGPPRGLDRDVFARLMTLAASLVLAAMARKLEQQARAGTAVAGPAGVLKELGETVMRGLADGTTRTFRRARFRRRMVLRRLGFSLRRPERGASLDELLGDLLEKEAPRKSRASRKRAPS